VLAAIRHAAVAASSFTASGLAVAITRRRTIRDRLALSPREAEVLRYLRDGLSIPAIALAMYISQSTARPMSRGSTISSARPTAPKL